MSTVSAMSSALCPGRGETGAVRRGRSRGGAAGEDPGTRDGLEEAAGGPARKRAAQAQGNRVPHLTLLIADQAPCWRPFIMSRKSAFCQQISFQSQ